MSLPPPGHPGHPGSYTSYLLGTGQIRPYQPPSLTPEQIAESVRAAEELTRRAREADAVEEVARSELCAAIRSFLARPCEPATSTTFGQLIGYGQASFIERRFPDLARPPRHHEGTPVGVGVDAQAQSRIEAPRWYVYNTEVWILPIRVTRTYHVPDDNSRAQIRGGPRTSQLGIWMRPSGTCLLVHDPGHRAVVKGHTVEFRALYRVLSSLSDLVSTTGDRPDEGILPVSAVSLLTWLRQ